MKIALRITLLFFALYLSFYGITACSTPSGNSEKTTTQEGSGGQDASGGSDTTGGNDSSQPTKEAPNIEHSKAQKKLHQECKPNGGECEPGTICMSIPGKEGVKDLCEVPCQADSDCKVFCNDYGVCKDKPIVPTCSDVNGPKMCIWGGCQDGNSCPGVYYKCEDEPSAGGKICK